MRGFSTTPLLPVAICLMSGIVVGSGWQPPFPSLFLLPVTIIATLVSGRWPVVQSLAIYCCFMVLGMTLIQLRHENETDLWNQELEAVVMSEPMERPKTIGVDLLVPCAEGRTIRCYLWKNERSKALKLGNELVVRLEESSTSRNHHEGATHTMMYFLHNKNWDVGGSALSQLSRWQRSRLWFLQQRHKLLKRYQGFQLEDDAYAVVAAMTLGDKSAQTRELREVFAISGSSHILAISGLHVGIVYMLLTWFMLGRRRFWLSQVVTVSAIWAFALLTGLSPSVTRAATMISIYALFAERGGRKSPINVLCFTVIVMLVADAQMLFGVSFQLSFSAIFAILTFLPLLQNMYQPENAILRWGWSLALLSLCAQLGVAPLIAYYFGRFSTYFLLTNFLVVPAATVILYGALVALLFPPASVVLLWAVKTMNGALRFIAALPGASIDGLHPTPVQVALTYAFLVICYLMLRKFFHYQDTFMAKSFAH